MPSNQSTNTFKNNFIFWKTFGLWGGRTPSKLYKYYSAIFLFVTFFSYNVLLTLNLIYTPPKLDLIIREVIFYFTEIAIIFKIYTIVWKRNKIIEAFDLIDCDEFFGDHDNKDGILYQNHAIYSWFWKLYTAISHIACFTIYVPFVLNNIHGVESELPISNYYFLSEDFKRSYFNFLFAYQSFGIYVHMTYNVNVDSFVAGLLMFAVAHLRLLNNKLSNLKLSEQESKLSKEKQDKISMVKLNDCLRYYDLILKYCETIQDVLSTVLFFQFSVSSAIICVVMCGLILPVSIATRVFLVMFFFAKLVPIFVPGFLGTHLSHESQEIVLAAYKSDWIPRTEPFKRSLRLLVERANISIVITGLKMFPLSLMTFTSIMKTAYSLFMLIRNLQANNN